MGYEESETVELKSVYVEDVKKEIVAFANTRGGVIYIGVEDDGIVCGVEKPDYVIQQITNAVRSAIKPDITMYLRYETKAEGEKTVIAVSVQCGAHRPYYLAAKGLRPEGVYVRQGTSSVPASDSAIRQMIRETDGDNYEDARSLNQELSFRETERAFRSRGIEFGEAQMKTLCMRDADGMYSNLALLLSDQCPHIIKAATFLGDDQNTFQDRREFGGSLLAQLEDTFAYLDLRNRTKATFNGLFRNDCRDYPETAIREALLNALIHRDYAVSAGTLVSVYANRIEIISVGGLAGGLSYDDMMLGVSFCRNKKLADVFYRLGLIEAYGTGVRKILSSYRDARVEPEIQVTSGAFKTVLPNINADTADEPQPEVSGGTKEQAVLTLLRKTSRITRADVEKELGVSSSTAWRVLKGMKENGIIGSDGRGKSETYFLSLK